MSSPVLPEPYQTWITELVGPIEPEHKATCHDCAMVPGKGGPPQQVYYRPELKCCTFYPNLPNFRAGAILRDAEAPGRLHLEKRIASAPGVTPMFVARPPLYDLIYRKSLAETSFGTIPKLRCPFLTDEGGCGVWRHRESTCATWFCGFNQGAVDNRDREHVGEARERGRAFGPRRSDELGATQLGHVLGAGEAHHDVRIEKRHQARHVRVAQRRYERLHDVALTGEHGVRRSAALHATPRTARELTRCLGRTADDGGDVIERDVEEIVEHERESLRGLELVEHHEEREPDRVCELELLLGIRGGGAVIARRQWILAARRARAQHVEADAPDDGRQPSARIGDIARFRAIEP